MGYAPPHFVGIEGLKRIHHIDTMSPAPGRCIYARIGGVNGIWTDFHSPDLADFETSEFAKFEDFSGNLVDFADMKTLKVCEFLRAESDQTLADSQTLKVCEVLSAESHQTVADSQTLKVCEFLSAESARLWQTRRL